MDTSKIIKGVVNSGRYSVTAPIIKEDYGLYLQIEGVELPQTYEVDFSNSEHSGTSVTMIGNSDGVLIPHQFIDTGKDVFAFLYHVGANYGRTVYKFRIPNKVRPDRTNEEPTPEEQSTIDQAINALNTAVEQTAQDVASADQSAQTAQGYAEQAETAKTNAQTYANNAQTSANNASASASQASASATASAQSASQSAQIKSDVEDLVDDAQASADASERSASNAYTYATSAERSSVNASASAQSASGYASQAQTSAQTASAKAQDASTSAQTASQKATESAQSASQALTYKTDAESAKTASQTAQGLAESARDTTVSAKTDAESARDDAKSARDEAQQAVASISGALDDKAPVITDTASGSIASFSDGADDLPLKSLVVNIDPVQDLHGQESPYPAGGGKNLLIQMPQKTSVINGVTWTINSDGSISANGTASGASTFHYIRPSDTTDTVFDGDYKYIQFPFVPLEVMSIGIKLTSWYSLYSQYVSSINGASGKIDTMWFQIKDGQTANVTFYPMIYSASETQPTAWSPYENICPISGWTEVNINHSDADTSNPTTITIQLGQTVYGGKLDVLSGELVIDRAMMTLNGSEAWKKDNDSSGYHRFYVDNNNIKKRTNYSGHIVSNACEAVNSYAYFAGFSGEMAVTAYSIMTNQFNYLYLISKSLPSVEDVKAFLASTPLQVVYELATPITIQLTPNQVNSLLGVNNLWADSGDTEVEYRADTKLFIERLTAPDSADMIADANITSGKYFMVGNSLYKATANIANGSAIIVGTNCTRKSLSEALNEINA